MDKIVEKILYVILIFLLLMAMPLTAKATIGKESTEVIRNPDRGFYKLVQRELNNGKEDFNDFIEEIKDIAKEDTDVSIISFQLNLKKFVTGNTPISSSKIEDINKYFSIMREYGYQVIFRVVYDSEGKENPEPEFETILTQMNQLKSVYQENQDILLVIEAGYLGSYGEWHSGKYDTSIENKNKIIDKLLEIVPESVQINLRRPRYITEYIGSNQTVTEENAYSSERIARLGLHNDGYLASETDLGTYEKSERSQSILWQEKQTLYTLFGGESQNKDSDYTDLDNAISDMNIRHCAYLNKTYDREVKEKWRNSIYKGEDTLYNGENGYKYIQNHLGYRLVLQDSSIEILNGNIVTNLKIENVGFGNIVRKKQIEIILQSDNNLYTIESDLDIRKCINEKVYILNIIESLPNNIEADNYNVFVNIKEPYETLNENDNYKIKFANINIWNEEVGGNYIGKVRVIESENNSNDNIRKIFFSVIIIIAVFLIYKLITIK